MPRAFIKVLVTRLRTASATMSSVLLSFAVRDEIRQWMEGFIMAPGK